MNDPQLTPERQLELWLAGDSRCPNTNNECCPDFSCCSPELRAPIETRQVFVDGDAQTRDHLLMGFLCGLVKKETKEGDVHVAGMVPEKEDA